MQTNVVAIAQGSAAYYSAAGMNFRVTQQIFAPPEQPDTGTPPALFAAALPGMEEGYGLLGALSNSRTPFGQPYTTTVTLDANCDMIIKGAIFGAYEGIEVVNMNDEVVAQTLALPRDREFKIKGLEAGQYTVRLKRYEDYNVPCGILITEQLIEPEIELPYATNSSALSITNPYTVDMMLAYSGVIHRLAAGTSTSISLVEGNNSVEYWLTLSLDLGFINPGTNSGIDSAHATATVIYDTVAPEIELINAFEDGDWIYMNFRANEQLASLVINGEEMLIGYGSAEDGSFTFSYCLNKNDENQTISIVATDYAGNTTTITTNTNLMQVDIR